VFAFPTNSRVKNVGLVPEIVCELFPLNLTVPLLCVKLAEVNAASPLSSSMADVEVKVVPDRVNVPTMVTLAEPPINEPPEKVAAPPIEIVLAFCDIVPA